MLKGISFLSICVSILSASSSVAYSVKWFCLNIDFQNKVYYR